MAVNEFKGTKLVDIREVSTIHLSTEPRFGLDAKCQAEDVGVQRQGERRDEAREERYQSEPRAGESS